MADAFDLDDVLNLEDEYYKEGYKEGQEHSTKQQYVEGKEYGYQTGFQRFLVVGYIQGLVEHWQLNLASYGPNTKSLESHLSQLAELVQSIPTNNGDSEVEVYEKQLSKARNKLRVVAMLAKESWKIAKLDELVRDVGGQLQVSENPDDMW